jgi:putative DNA primase/helicase
MDNLQQRADHIVNYLKGHWYGSYAMCCCPAHNDRTPSLQLRIGDTNLLYKCYAGCSKQDILAALARLNLTPANPSGYQTTYTSPYDRRECNTHSGHRSLAMRIWQEAEGIRGTLGERYLHMRGIDLQNLPFRFAAHTKIRHDQNGKLVSYPAMIAEIRDDKGLKAVQRTLLSPNGTKARIGSPKRILGEQEGGAVRIGARPSATLNLAEGIEDALSVIIIKELDHCWAVCGIDRYARIDIPASVTTICIYSQHGHEAARARPHLCANQRHLEIILPPPEGDWNDHLQNRLKMQTPNQQKGIIYA